MTKILLQYQMDPATWIYLSSLLILGIYFKFHRVLSVRNLDLIGLIVFSPGLLLVSHGEAGWGYGWLFAVGALYLVRLLLDPLMVRRPLLDPNLNASGMTFTAISMFVFLVAHMATDQVPKQDPTFLLNPVLSLADTGEAAVPPPERYGPGYAPFARLVTASRRPAPAAGAPGSALTTPMRVKASTKVLALMGLAAVVVAMVLIGYRHFDNVQTGVAAAALYLLLPYTTQMTPRLDHVLPAALLIWAVQSYRRPLVAGLLVGLAAVVFYPLLLVPLWSGFYWQRGLLRFWLGLGAALAVLVLVLLVGAPSAHAFTADLGAMFGVDRLIFGQADGFWQFNYQALRIPVAVAVVALAAGLAVWPAQKNLGTLLSCSAAVMLASQFCHVREGGLYMAWYLPMLVMTILRPNLEDRVAISAVRQAPDLKAQMRRLAGLAEGVLRRLRR